MNPTHEDFWLAAMLRRSRWRSPTGPGWHGNCPSKNLEWHFSHPYRPEEFQVALTCVMEASSTVALSRIVLARLAQCPAERLARNSSLELGSAKALSANVVTSLVVYSRAYTYVSIASALRARSLGPSPYKINHSEAHSSVFDSHKYRFFILIIFVTIEPFYSHFHDRTIFWVSWDKSFSCRFIDSR